MEYQDRSYRQTFRQDDLVHFQVIVGQTDLDIGVRRERFSPEMARWVEELVRRQREFLEKYIEEHPAFLHALSPCELKPGAPSMAVEMAGAARLAGVGPMAAVAGAFAQYVGRALSRRTKDVIVENGGDIYLRSTRQRRVGIFAGKSPSPTAWPWKSGRSTPRWQSAPHRVPWVRPSASAGRTQRWSSPLPPPG